ncbi:metalloregulator ArsR/SmtB family transcription factor [Allopontixanthobacter sp.]|uniref:ArsR/SmtB family transcription factor n=1 Tax=Allopontixanthobacter sp. TaxID=2906452 RepID=UPI002AB85C94|nr:metalloregulator ArsR/SmtB family transcription factor [Allopontixanthobacter sp.]MDZ4306380.1 metalloregulator ArsR/SmtB family transcription factor [Allopontixanthobacter sp.]
MRIEIIMRALADPTRLRMMRLLGVMELAVGELAQVLGQSQPRVSRHIGILCDAGLADRHREGSWVFLRAQSAAGRPVVEAVAGLLAAAEEQDAEFRAACEEDRRQLAAIRAARDESAASYFAAHARDWDRLRSLHSPDVQVEARLLEALGDVPLGAVLDIGTGTGRMAEMFAPRAASIVALDKSLDMLRLARAKLQHLPAGGVELVQGDFANLPFAAHRFDTVLLHHVLHFAQDPAAAIAEAARVTRPGGRIVIVDFASHEREELRERYAHARLGFTDNAMAELLEDAGYRASAPLALHGGELVVKIWLGDRDGAAARQLPRKKAAQ